MASATNVLASGIEINGSIRFSNDMIIDGKSEGEIISDKGRVTIGENALVKGDVTAGEVKVFGKIEGKITEAKLDEIPRSQWWNIVLSADKALGHLEVDKRGLDALDHRYLHTVAVNFGGGPVGIETIAASLSEARDAIEEIIEPYLIQQGFLQRTPRGRIATARAYEHLGIPPPAGLSGSLF